MFASKEAKFEDVLAAQKQKQDDLLSSLQGSGKSSGKSKKWQKLKKKKTDKKDSAVQEEEAEEAGKSHSGVENEEPSSDSLSQMKLDFEAEAVVVEAPKPSKKKKN